MDRRQFIASAGAIALSDNPGRAEEALGHESPHSGGLPPNHAGAEPAATSIERQLAEFASSLRYDDLPGNIVEAVKGALIDTLACAFGAVGSQPAQIVEATYRARSAAPLNASVIGGSHPISMEGAALVNGVLVRYLDLNDVFAGRDPTHPSECIPAALACCEEQGLGGRRLIEAILVGYEAQLALVDAFSFSGRGFHSLSCAGYAVPLLAGRMWNLTPEQMINAMGIAGPRMFCVLAINRGPISMMKALPYAQDAMDALFATRLAAAGFTGAEQSIAWFAANVRSKRPDGQFKLEKGKFKITQVGVKRFPLQFELQAVAQAGVALHAQVKSRIGDIASISVETLPATIERTAGPSRYRPNTKETADHSLPVCLAMALLDGEVSVAQFDAGRWRSPEVLELAGRVRVGVSRRLATSDPSGAGADVKVNFSDGSGVAQAVDIPEGDPRRPISRAAQGDKFLRFASPRLGEGRAERALDLVDRLEELDDVRVLMKAMQQA